MRRGPLQQQALIRFDRVVNQPADQKCQKGYDSAGM